MNKDDKVKMTAPADKAVIPNVCEWYTEEFASEEDTDVAFETSCVQGFQFNNGSPSTNDFKFCPFCGRAIMEI